MDGNELSLDGLDIDPNIIRRAWEGDSHAQLEVGSVYFVSVYVEDNLLNASKWISRSAAQGNMEAQFWLGNLYSLGQGVKQSYVDAHQWYTKSAIQGYKKALRRIHNLYQQDKKMHSHGKLNAKEDLKKVPRFLGEEQKYYYRELYEQRLDEEKQKLSNTINHFSQSFQEYKSLDQNDPVVQVDLAFLYQHGYGTIENVGLAIEYYTKASTQGHHDAQYNLGYIYQQNTNLKFHYRLALRWLRTSATNGNIAAQNSLAYYYEKGLATEIDYGGAIYWYTKAAVAGNSDAQLTLGKWYRKGEYVQKDLSEAVKWYKLAAQHGNGAAQNCLTQLNEDGIYQHVPNTSTKKTPRSKLQNDLTKLNSVGYFQALQKLCHHARMSDGNAMYQIGLKYYNGKDFTQDKDIALYWIKNAAKAGIQNAEKKIAQMYEEGDATDQDYHESSKWFKKGAAKKNDGAQSKLGTLFKNGLGVRRDPLEASKWFTLSAKQGNSDALCQLGLLLSKGEGLRWDGRKATVHFRQSALSGNPDALFQLGQIYENIHDSDDDFIALYNIRSEYLNFQRTQDVAIRLYRYSAKLGNNDAQNKLGQLYEKGTIVPLNFQQAEEYYTMASDSDNPIHKVNLAKKYLDRIFPCGDYIKIFHLIKHAAEQKHYDATRLFQTPITLGETFFDLTKVIDMFKEVSQKSIENLEYNIGYAYEHGIASHSKLNSVPVDYVSAIEWYSVGAEKGDSRAQFRLGMMYDEGKGVEQNRSIAFSCYSQAHGNGNSDATYTLAQMYLNGYGVEQDLVKAYHLFSHTSSMGHKGATQILYPSNSNGNMEMLEKIASLGNVALQHQLGIFHQEDNETLALKWFSLATEGGMTDAYYWLGVFCEEGRGTDRDYSKAMELYENAAAKDHEEATYRLAQIYLHGKGTKVDYEKAYRFYTIAAKQGHYLSRKILNITNQPFSALYDKIEQDSPGVGSDSKNMDYSFPSTSDEFGYSMEMYKHIAEKGDIEAQYMLGLIFEDIFSVPSYSEALKWFTMSAGNSHPRAIYRLGLLYEKGLGVSQNYHKAAQLYEESSGLEDSDAIYRYAKLFHYGKGVDVDFAKAVDYYTAAACRGNPEAQFALAIIYEEGELTERNILEAIKLFTNSSLQNHDGANLSLFNCYDESCSVYDFYKRLFRNMGAMVDFILDLKSNDYILYIAFLDNEKTGSSMYILGRLYLFGLGTQKNWLKAWEYLTAATKEYGYPDTEYLIDSILSKHLSELSELSHRTRRNTEFYAGCYLFFLANQNKTVSHRVKFRSKCVDPAIIKDGSSTFAYYQKAMDYLSRSASDGDREAQYYLGNMYSNGYGTEIDKQQAIAWYSEAAERDHVDAQYELGMLYFTGVNSNIDYRLSLKFIKRAALTGHRKAIFHIGWMYKHGLGFTKSEEEANEWFNISLPSRKIQFSYGFDLAALIGKIKRLEAENVNNPATETNLETLSYNGDGHASYTLSQKFLNGKDFEVDNTKGMTYLRMGASQGHYLCQEELAFIYYHGVNIRKDLRLAFLWFKRGEERNKRGEERGSSKLKFHLAQIYHCGVIGGDVQFTKALQLYQDIGVEHLPLVLQQKGLMYEHGDELKKSYSLAYRYYIKSFNQGNFISGYNVALLYFYGKGVKQDSIEAVYWLEKSLDKSTLTHLHYILLETEFSQAATLAGTPRKTYSLVTYDAFIGEILYLLGKIYSDGLGVPRNDEKALLYFKQAGEKGNENAKKYFNENPQ